VDSAPGRVQAHLGTRPEYAILESDLAFLFEEVRAETSRLPSDIFPVDLGDTIFDAALYTSWDFALVTLAAWIGHAVGASEEVRRRSLVACYYLYRYILHLDRLIDADRYALEHSPFSPGALGSGVTLLYFQAMRHFQRLFPPDSTFWDHLERYHIVWAEALVWERDPTRFAGLPLWEAMERESGKCAALYSSCAAIAIGAGKEELLPTLERATMLTNMLMNLVDDSRDWAVDLADGRHNSFVSLAGSHGLVPALSTTQESMAWAMMPGRLLDLYVDVIESLAEQIREIIVPLKVTLWLPFLDEQVELARAVRDEFRQTVTDVTTRLFGSSDSRTA
jgi:hypothetical protein